MARADGDPASDVLLLRNVFLPYEAPSPSVAGALEQAANAVYLHGDRLKVAVIYSRDDLGAIPSLFGQPAQYAQFLGIELGLWYVGPLLVVMPNGVGIYDGGRPTAAEQQVFARSPSRPERRTTSCAVRRRPCSAWPSRAPSALPTSGRRS